MTDAQLSKNFTLSEFLLSQTAERHGIDMTPDAQVIANLTRLCGQLLQPLREHLATPIRITSGYRPLQLNRLIGSSDKSQHIVGLAADFIVPGYEINTICNHLCAMTSSFDQLINEFGRWIHVSIHPVGEKPRLQRLVARHAEGVTRYEAA